MHTHLFWFYISERDLEPDKIGAGNVYLIQFYSSEIYTRKEDWRLVLVENE